MTQLALVQIAEDIIGEYRPRPDVVQSVSSVIRGWRGILDDKPVGADPEDVRLIVRCIVDLSELRDRAETKTRTRPRRKFQQVPAGEYPTLRDACDALGMVPPAADVKPDTVVRLRARGTGRPCGKAYAYPSGNGGVVIDYDTNQKALFLSERTLGNLTKGVDHGNV